MNKTEYDLAIAGGGVVGAMVAWHALRRHPEWRVLWFDRGLFGFGASAYAGGLLTPFGRTQFHRELLVVGRRILKELEDSSGPLPLRELDAFYAISPQHLQERQEWFIDGPPAVVTPESEQRLLMSIPDLRLDGKRLLGPFRLRQGSPLSLITRVVAQCRDSERFSIWEGVELTAWSQEQGPIRLDFGGEPSQRVARLVLALGSWAGSAAMMQSVVSGLHTKRVAACHIEVVPDDAAPALYLGDEDSFLLPLPSEERWLFGFPSEQWNISPAQGALDKEDRVLAEAILSSYSPGFSNHRRGGRSFPDAYTTNWTPVVTRVQEGSNVVFAGACSGSGFRLAPALSERAIQLVENLI